MKKTLEIGDVVYSYSYGNISTRRKIDRVTPKYAFIGSNKFRRELTSGDWVSSANKQHYNSVSYYLATPERDKKWRMVVLKQKIRSFDFKKLSKFSEEELTLVWKLLDKKLDE